MPLTDNIDFGPNTKKYQDHIVCSYSYKLVCVDDQYSKLDKSYFGEDAIDKFLNDMIKESKYCSKVIETKRSWRFNNSAKYWNCKKAYGNSEVKVKDHDHFTEKYRGSAHQECNLNLSVKKIFFVFYN